MKITAYSGYWGKLLFFLAALFSMPFWAVWPFGWLGQSTDKLSFPLSVIGLPLEASRFAAALLLSDMTRYLGLSFFAGALNLAAIIILVVGKQKRIWRSLFFPLCAFGLTTLALFPAAIGPYRPAVSVKPGVESCHVTRPERLKNVIKSLQSEAEVRSETYELLGWADARRLVYRVGYSSGNNCPDVLNSGAAAVAAAYDIDSGISRVWDGEIDALYRESCLQSRCILPSLTSSQDGRAYLPGCDYHSLLSPDGNWVAFVVAHLYGPEDVMILANAEQDASDQDAVNSGDVPCGDAVLPNARDSAAAPE